MTQFKTIEAIVLPDTVKPALKAYAFGYNTAIKLSTGDVFRGALDIADEHFKRDSAESDMFISGYVAGIDARFPDASVPCRLRMSDGASIIQ